MVNELDWWTAVENGNVPMLLGIVSVYAGCRNHIGQTALHMAVQMQNVAMIQILAAHEHSLLTPDGRTALMLAIEGKYVEGIDLLVPYEAEYVTPLGITALMHAAQIGYVPAVERLLGYNLNFVDSSNRTALIYAVEHKNTEAMKLILSKGASSFMADARPALDIAKSTNQELAARILTDYISKHEHIAQGVDQGPLVPNSGSTGIGLNRITGVMEDLDEVKNILNTIQRSADPADVEAVMAEERRTSNISPERGSIGTTGSLTNSFRYKTDVVSSMRNTPQNNNSSSLRPVFNDTNDGIESIMRINPVENEINTLKASFRSIGNTGKPYVTRSGKVINTPSSEMNSATNTPTGPGITGSRRIRGTKEPSGGRWSGVTSSFTQSKLASTTRGTTSIVASKRAFSIARQKRPLYFGEENTKKAPVVSGVDLNATKNHSSTLRLDNNDHTALMEAARLGNASRVKELIKSESGRQNKDGYSALMYASIMDQLECAQILLPYEVGLTTDNGWTALMLAAEMGNVRLVNELLPHEACYQDHDGYTALMIAAEEGHGDVVKLLIPKEAGMNDNQGGSALMRAASNGHSNIVALLVPHEGGMQRKDGYTALMSAAYHGHLASAELLVPEESGMTMGDGWTALMCAAQNGHLGVVRCLGSEEGMKTVSGWCAVMSAASNNHRKVVDLLVNEIPIKDKSGNDARTYARLNGHDALFDYMSGYERRR